ncbi:MAG: sugar ABC transporter permease [Deinococcota bacterium]
MKTHERTRTILMLAPAVLVLLIFYGGALLTVILQSFGYAPLYGINTFPTLSHYRDLFTSVGFWGSLGLTLTYALVPTIIGTLLSIHLALLLQRKGWGQRVFRYVYTLPLVVPYLVGVALITLLWANGGLFARIAFNLGWIESTRDFPRVLYSRAGWGVMLVYIWKQLPFTTLLLSSLLAGSSPDYEAAAATLGANSWQRFWHVTLPKLVPGIVSATLIVFAFNAGSFEVPFILGGGFPNTLPVEAWRAFNDADPARRLTAMTIMTVVAVLSSLILLVYLSFYKRLQRAWGDA